MKKLWQKLGKGARGAVKGVGIGVFITAGLIALGVPVPLATTAGQTTEKVYEHIQENRGAEIRGE